MLTFSHPLPDLTSTLPRSADPLNGQLAQQIAARAAMARTDVRTAAALGQSAVDVAGQAYQLARKIGASAIVQHPGGGFTTHHVALGTPPSLAPARARSALPVSRPTQAFHIIQHGLPTTPVGITGLPVARAPAATAPGAIASFPVYPRGSFPTVPAGQVRYL